VITQLGPQSSDNAASIAVPAVFLVFRKMNLCSCETITGYILKSAINISVLKEVCMFVRLLGNPTGNRERHGESGAVE
jgi:hypothetical protein